MGSCTWKSNWAETREHFIAWWNHRGVVVSSWDRPDAVVPHDPTPVPPYPSSEIRCHYEDVAWRARHGHARLGKGYYGADILPVADNNIGPGSLALALGCEPGFAPETVWFKPALHTAPDVKDLPPLRFNPDAPWWQVHEAQLHAQKALAAGQYLVGLPDLVENIDILAALRDPQILMIDMLENPGWVCRAVAEINQAFFAGYSRLYDISKEADGSSVWGAFRIWGPGKTAKVQCDASAMFSPAMFRDFVKPALTEQCAWLDYAMYHLDGTQCICHLDHLLDIAPLRAIEWTPQDGMERGAHERWFPLYKRILDAGKSVQIIGAGVHDVERILKALGGNGVYILCDFVTPDEAETAARIADRWR